MRKQEVQMKWREIQNPGNVLETLKIRPSHKLVIGLLTTRISCYSFPFQKKEIQLFIPK